MTDRLFFDTNVLVYALDRNEVAKRERAASWIRFAMGSGVFVVSPQVLNECYRASRKRFETLEPRDLQEFLAAFMPSCIAPYDTETTVRAWAIEQRFGFAWWDSVLLASATQARCRFFLTEDLQHGQIIDQTRIIDPFTVEPAQFLSTMQ